MKRLFTILLAACCLLTFSGMADAAGHKHAQKRAYKHAHRHHRHTHKVTTT
jgi:hypothetical protein